MRIWNWYGEPLRPVLIILARMFHKSWLYFIIQRVAKAKNTFKSPSPGWSRSIPLLCPQLERSPGTISHQGLRKQYEARLEICQKIYTTNFRAKEFYTLQTRELWLLGPMLPSGRRTKTESSGQDTVRAGTFWRKNQPGTMKNHDKTTWNHEKPWKQT